MHHDGASPLKGKSMQEPPFLDGAWMQVNEEGNIQAIGTGEAPVLPGDNQFNMEGSWVFPAFCDSHTHLVFPEWRPEEFLYKIRGMSYAEIAQKGGGILNSAQKMELADEGHLFAAALRRCHECMAFGTGALEIKSGYGLSLESELKMLRVIARLKESLPIPVKATLLGAHALPPKYKERREDFIDMIVHRLIPAAAADGLADYVDVFCDTGFFTPEETERILEVGARFGLRGKIHANELGNTGGIQAGVAHQALSVDHLEHTGPEEIQSLLNSNTIPTLLPGTAFFLKMDYPPARTMVDAGLPLCLATDYNPGSCPSGNPWFIWSLASIYMGLEPEEALSALSLNGAHAMELQHSHGSLWPGKVASFISVEPMETLAMVPYRFGSGLKYRVFIQGKEYNP